MPSPIPLLSLAIPMLAQGNYFPRIDLEEGRFLKAMAEAEAQIKMNPNHALAWAAKAHALSAFLRFPEAIECANRALFLDPTIAEAYLARGLARGGYAIQQRNFSSLRKAAGALQDMKRATELDPNFATAWMCLGLSFQQLPGILGGSTSKALRCAESLRKVHPNRGNLLNGMILSLDNQWNEAEPFFALALSNGASDPQVVAGFLEALGSRETREALGETGQKTRLIQDARRLFPGVKTRAKGLEAICDALLDGGQAEEAWNIALESLPRVDAPSLIRFQLGKIAAKGGIHSEPGLGFLDQVLSEPLEGGSGGIAGAWWRKGQIQRNLGQKQAARDCAKKALGCDPKHPGAIRLLKELS